jgi:hypothetical protein
MKPVTGHRQHRGDVAQTRLARLVHVRLWPSTCPQTTTAPPNGRTSCAEWIPRLWFPPKRLRSSRLKKASPSSPLALAAYGRPRRGADLSAASRPSGAIHAVADRVFASGAARPDRRRAVRVLTRCPGRVARQRTAGRGGAAVIKPRHCARSVPSLPTDCRPRRLCRLPRAELGRRRPDAHRFVRPQGHVCRAGA